MRTCLAASNGFVTLWRLASSISASLPPLYFLHHPLVPCSMPWALLIWIWLELSSPKLSSEWHFWHQTLLIIATAPFQAYFDQHYFSVYVQSNCRIWILLFELCARGAELHEYQRICTDHCTVQLPSLLG